MGFFNKYPYTDFHELNADWLLKEMQELDQKLDYALEELSNEVYARVLREIEPELHTLRNDINVLTNDFNRIRGEFEALDRAFDAFKIYVNNELDQMMLYLAQGIQSANDYTNRQIEQNNIYLLDQMQTYLSNIKVINFFTGELVSIQDMFDYLAALHTTDSIDYDTMATRAKTYTELEAFNKTYTELVMSGNTWYI